MYHVSPEEGADERMINVLYYYYSLVFINIDKTTK